MADEEAGQQEYQKKLRKRVEEAIRRAQLEERKKEMVKQVLDDMAFERLMNIKVSNGELYAQLVDMLIRLAQAGKVQGKVTEKQFRELLARLTTKRETTIEFKHK
jgi:programmed cell death protein 5